MKIFKVLFILFYFPWSFEILAASRDNPKVVDADVALRSPPWPSGSSESKRRRVATTSLPPSHDLPVPSFGPPVPFIPPLPSPDMLGGVEATTTSFGPPVPFIPPLPSPDMLGEVEATTKRGGSEVIKACPKAPDRRSFGHTFARSYEVFWDPHSFFSKDLIHKNLSPNKELGRGNLSIVYEANNIAVKVSPIQRPHHVQDFKKEVEFLQKLKEVSGVLPILAAAILPDDLAEKVHKTYLVMPKYTGTLLKQYNDKYQKSSSQERGYFVLDTYLNLSPILEQVHKKEIVHLDIKPENVLLDINGNLILSDFQIAETVNTSTENTEGDARFLPPFAFEDYEIATPKKDWFALAKMLVIMLEGEEFPKGSGYGPSYLKQSNLHELLHFIQTSEDPSWNLRDPSWKEGETLRNKILQHLSIKLTARAEPSGIASEPDATGTLSLLD